MRKISIFFGLLLSLAIIFNACKKDDFTEQDAIKEINDNALFADSLANNVILTVKVIDATTDFSTKSNEKGLASATVTVNHDGVIDTAATGVDGSAHFDDLRPGSYAVQVTMTGFTTVDFVATMQTEGYYSVQVPVLSTTNLMTVTGKVEYESDLLNTSRETGAVTVVADPNFANLWNTQGINDFSYSGYTNTATTDAATGAYTLTLPADKAGKLTYTIGVAQFEENQSLLLNTLDGADVTGNGNGTQSIPTRFGTGVGASTAVPAVPSVYCVIGAPDHTFTAAALTVEIVSDNERVVDKAHVTNEGADYGPNNPTVVVNNPNAAGTDATVVLHTGPAGQIEWIEVTGGGSDFNSTPTLDLSFEQDDAEIEVATIGGSGEILTLTVTDAGYFLTNELTLSGGSGSGATYTVSWIGGTHYEVSGVTDGGTGYVVGDDLTVIVPTTEGAGSVTMKTGSVSSVQVTSQGTGYPINRNNLKVVFNTGNAIALAHTDAYGRVFRVEVTDGGYDYSSTPTATVNWTITNENATAGVFVQDGEVKSVFGLYGGKGYDDVPVINFFSQLTGNAAITGIVSDVTVNNAALWDVTGITCTGGSNLPENLAKKNADGTLNNVKSVPGGTVYKDFYLGTGVRTAGE